MMLWFDLALMLVVLGLVAVRLTFGAWKETYNIGFTAVPLFAYAVGVLTTLICLYVGMDTLAAGSTGMVVAVWAVPTTLLVGYIIIKGADHERPRVTVQR